ncbi:hypothetical protein PHYPSEUDO_009921 [Phytophthora pseudosyringae]|uniref:Fibronectin type-III domain-containing protein n=1 Tax=Phytophthora pseudosyringae TaxID=221518 RepID=A0A8T1VC88_9STRA|nr:hypothetical protein PHYPSEUDO_009921 [Phytophthora pseudosyringae]
MSVLIAATCEREGKRGAPGRIQLPARAIPPEAAARMTHDGCPTLLLLLLLLLALCSLRLHVGVQASALDLRVPGIDALYDAACPFLGCAAEAGEAPTTDDDDLFPAEMPRELHGEKTARKYPAFPHAPLLVAAGTCDAVVLRWRSFETLLWPVERFVLQRYPDRQNQPQWTTLLDENTSELVDLDVHPGRRYAYRVQAICRDNVSSAYEYHWTQVDEGESNGTAACRSSAALLGSLNAEGIRSLGLIFACFLTVYGLMRASVMGVQGTQSRSYRLKRIKKSTSEVVAPAASMSTGQGVSMLPRRSSTSTSSSSPSVEVDPSQRGSTFDGTNTSTTATTGTLTRAHSSTDAMLRQESVQTSIPGTFRPISRSIGTIDEKASACQHCGKRFGLFRRRYMCDICHSVSLCRKCGYQASVDSFANARTGMQMNSVGSTGGRGMGRRRSSLSQQQQKKLKIRTICRNCCDDVYRYSTHASVYVHAEM